MLGKSLIQAAAVKTGATGGLGIEELFQTWLYTGNGSTQTITNGIDLAGEGGLVWCKSRSDATLHELVDTARGVRKRLDSASTAAEVANADLEAFNSDGFRLGFYTGGANLNGTTYASWTFRKAPGFFDVVTYTGNGIQGRAINHNLGSVPGCIIVKCTSSAYGWIVYHRSTGKDEYLVLSSTGASTVDTLRWNSTNPTSSQFTVGNAVSVNETGQTYVAYLFAHDEQIFGEGSDQSVIKCGSFLSQSGNVATVELGWEPQWVLVKSATGTGSWRIIDNMRGWTLGNDAQLVAEQASAEAASDLGHPTSTGFYSSASVIAGDTGIYIAIRRGPMKTPTDATKVFASTTTSSTAAFTTGFTVDWNITKPRPGSPDYSATRLTGNNAYLVPTSTAAEASIANLFDFASNTTFKSGAYGGSAVQWSFRRAPGFFDVVAYTGTNTLNNVPHNLGAIPEILIIKNRTSSVANWIVYSAAVGNDKVLVLNSDVNAFVAPVFNNTTPTSSVFTLQGDNLNANRAGNNFIAYLFATLPGISKVFSFTGNGTSQTIDCGFAAGARFVLLKRTDSAGNWLVADTARGIISGNDPLLYLNSTAAEITTLDWIDPYSSGFIVNQEATANANVGGATYIGLAIA